MRACALYATLSVYYSQITQHLSLELVRAEPVRNDIVPSSGVIMEVQSMSRHRLDIRLKAARIGEVLAHTGRHARGRTTSSKAVTTTVRQIVLASHDAVSYTHLTLPTKRIV